MTNQSRNFAALVLLASLTACSPAGDADPVKRQAGGWEITRNMVRFEAPAMPADMIAAAKSSIGKPDVGLLCLKPETAAKDTLAVRINDVIQLGPEWKIQTSKLENGKVNFAASFDQPDQGKGEMTITGTLSDTASDLTLITKGVDFNNTATESEMRVESRHLGECPPDAMEQ
jgi:Protein of unknown function (DUF3617)